MACMRVVSIAWSTGILHMHSLILAHLNGNKSSYSRCKRLSFVPVGWIGQEQSQTPSQCKHTVEGYIRLQWTHLPQNGNDAAYTCFRHFQIRI